VKRWLRRLAIAGSGLILLLSFLAVFVTLLVRSSWFQDFVRKQIVSAIQRSTGAQVEAGSIHLS